MQKRTTTFRTEHHIELTNGELNTIILNAIREEFPETPRTGGARVVFGPDMFGMTKASVSWNESSS